MTERVVTFGSHSGLVGIVTEPDTEAQRAGAPAVIFSNIGLNHRVGPNRLYVALSRKLAEAGFLSLRFDLSGYGDSEPRHTGDTDLQRAILDTREAMDFLQKRGINRFVLAGLCSGVDSAHCAALEDSRVAGAIFIEGYVYRNPGFWLRFWSVRNLQPARWRRFARVRLSRLMGTRPVRDMDDAEEIFEREFPSRAQFAADLATLTARAVKMLFVYTINQDGRYNYRNQFHDTFGYRDTIDVEYYTRADHVFSTELHRERLLGRLVEWMDDRFPRHFSPSETSPGRASAPALYLVGAASIISVSRLVGLVTDINLLGT